MATYNTIDAALSDIASRSFYESARAYRTESGKYIVEDWHTDIEEYRAWSYANGLDVPAGTVDYSRTHESCEFYDHANHVRYNLPNAVELLEAGSVLGFTYVIAQADCEDDVEDCQDDHIAGWALIATSEVIL